MNLGGGGGGGGGEGGEWAAIRKCSYYHGELSLDVYELQQVKCLLQMSMSVI